MSIEVLKPSFDLEAAIAATAETGYFFGREALTDVVRQQLQAEIDSLPLEVADHIARPINEGQPNEVRQQHARYYVEYGTEQTPLANMVIDGLATAIQRLKGFPELAGWQPNEIGYQRYRRGHDFIGPHRDRESDQLLSATFTIAGSAMVRIFEAADDSLDYSDLRKTDEFSTKAGSVMLLRAPGLANGAQTIHQVLRPKTESRSILNLRMRPTILSQPGAS